MRLKGLTSLVFSFLVGCSVYTMKYTNHGWIKSYEDNTQIEMKKEGSRVYFYRIPIENTEYLIEGVDSKVGSARLNAEWFLYELNFFGINPLLLEEVDKNNNRIIEESEHEKYRYLRTYFYRIVEK